MREFSLLDIIKYYMKYFWVVLIVSVLACFIGYFYIENIFEPTYKESTTIILGKSNNVGEAEISSSTMTLYDSLINNYLELLGSNKLLANVKNDLDLEYDVKSLSGMINYSTSGSSQMIQISVTNNSDKLAAEICNGIVVELKKQVYDIYGIDNINIVDEARASSKQVYSDMFILLLFVLGEFIISSIIIILKFIFSDKIICFNNTKKVVNIDIIGKLTHRKINKIPTLLRTLSDYEIDKFRDIRSELLSNVDKDTKVIMISNIYKNKSKSYITYNLASAIKNIDKKVLIIDIDNEDNKLNLEFNKDVYNIKGRGKKVLNSKFKRVNNIDMLFLDDAIDIDRLATEEFMNIMSNLRGQYDYIFMKSSSFRDDFETTTVLELVDGIVIIDRENKCRVTDLNKVKNRIVKLDKKLIGIIFENENNKNKYFLSHDDLDKKRFKYRISKRLGIAKRKFIKFEKFLVNIKKSINIKIVSNKNKFYQKKVSGRKIRVK